MEKLNPYLTFPGNCEEAFNFYKSIFGGEFSYVGRYRDIPSDEGLLIPEYKMNKIMHIALPLAKNACLWAVTVMKAGAQRWFWETMSPCPSMQRARNKPINYLKVFVMKVQITMQIGDVFWGSYYGMCTDKFGVTWIINYVKPEGNIIDMEALEIKTAMQIARSKNDIFEAIVEPEIMSNYFISHGSGRMEEGKTLEWTFPGVSRFP